MEAQKSADRLEHNAEAISALFSGVDDELARWRWNPKAVEKLRDIQQTLLQKAAGLCRSGTKILYSTCSIQPDENQEQVQSFLAERRQFTLIAEKLTLPSVRANSDFDRDGGYAGVMQMK